MMDDKKIPDGQKDVEQVIAFHPELWKAIVSDPKKEGRSNRKQIQWILLNHYGFDASAFIVEGNNKLRGDRVATPRPKKNGKRRA
jgi:hypothetical protein